ncbi:MAG: carboxyl transferase domain-containing protein, partial [Thermodesulfobacteriota bacterium]|nr:carboxyl transferase domain-containing protein [Thermodesulfobacteriota bacterium]
MVREKNMTNKYLCEDLIQRKEKALRMGGEKQVKRQHEAGKLTARERTESLLDSGSFIELGILACSDMAGMEDSTPADGIITGYGHINGRQIGIIASDFTVLASTN